MRMNTKLAAVSLLIASVLPSAMASSNAPSSQNPSPTSVQQMIQNHQLNPEAVKHALNAYQWALSKGYVKNKEFITLVDFTKASNQKRMYILDVNTQQVVLNTYVAHGKNSGLTTTNHFSNAPGSNASMYGAFVTTTPYGGKHGESLRIQGLEKGINDNAMSRAVVIHSAWYVNPSFIKQFGRAGRSEGCFAVGQDQITGVISKIKDYSFLYAYAAQENSDPIANSQTA
jgi:hypothetical protein